MNTDCETPTSDWDEMESDLYTALEALENHDLITIRQCASRVQFSAIEMWQQKNRSESVDK